MKRFTGLIRDGHDLGVQKYLYLSAAMYYPLTILGHGFIYTF